MKSWTLGRKILTGVGLLVGLAGATLATGLWAAAVIKGDLDLSVAESAALEHALRLERDMAATEGDERMMLLASLEHDRALYTQNAEHAKESHAAMVHEVAEMNRLASADEAAAIKAISDNVQQWATLHHEFVRHIDGGSLPAAQQLLAGRIHDLAAKTAEMADEFVKRQDEHLQHNVAEAQHSYREVQIVFAVVALGVVGLGALVTLVVRGANQTLRDSVSELSEGAQQVAAASGQVSSVSQTLSQGATEQAASLEETSASMEEIASMTRQNAKNSESAAATMSQADALMQDANAALAEMTTSMSEIKESSDKVGRIIKTIDEIAFQTNILALNAAVEAARAGEAGAGFAVVADEVRSLAQRSAQAARDTAGLIEESIARSSAGQQKVERVATAITSLTSSTSQVKQLVGEVSVASRQQSQGIDQVSQAIAQMEKVTQGTAATAEESAAASEELNAQAEVSMSVVARLSAMVGSTHETPPARRPATTQPSSSTPAARLAA